MRRTLPVVVWLLMAGGAALTALGATTGLSTLTALGLVSLLLGVVRMVVTPRGWLGAILRAGAWTAAVVATLAPAAAIAGWWYLTPERPDAFYAAPADVPGRPGVLLRTEPYTRGVPAGARGWRILYTTTRHDGSPAVASALVLVSMAQAGVPVPAVLWTHGTTGSDPACAPSLLPDPYPFDPTIPGLDQVIASGWTFIAPDYAGLGTAGPHPYLIGEGEARSALDAVRAAREVDGIALDGRTVVWGHSQGGHAALWTGIAASTYAREIDLVGVAALAPATDVAALVDGGRDTFVGKIISAIFLRAYAESYPEIDLDTLVRPAARWLVRDLATRCLAWPSVVPSIAQVTLLERGPLWAVTPSSDPALARRMEENTPRGPIVAPLLVAQGLDDELVLPRVQQAWVDARCAAGHALDYWTYAGRDHLTLVGDGSPLRDDLMTWTRERLERRPVDVDCRTLAR